MAATDERERFAGLLGALFGLRADSIEPGALDDVLAARVAATRATSVGAYLARLAAPESRTRAEVRALAEAVTVTESYFFRLPGQFDALAESILPERRAHAAAERRPLRILSAGASGGEEAYSIAILLDDATRRGEQVEITGIDVNPAVLDRARQGRYSAWSLRETPRAVVERCFARTGSSYQLHDRIRALVRFEERNLVDEDPSFFSPGRFDVIFFRNVGIYFASEVLRSLVERFHRTLAPGGYLFLGPAENLRDHSAQFALCASHDVFYHRRRDEGETATEWAASIPPATPWRRGARLSPLPAAPAMAAPSARLAPRPDRSALSEADRVARYEAVLELFRRERFLDARSAIEELPSTGAEGRFSLVRAALHVQLGERTVAETILERAIEIEPVAAPHHLLFALCREQAGDEAGVRRHLHAALFLDPEFALAHLHGGRLARRAGDLDSARRSLRLAEELLPKEAQLRLLLLGGGFSRAALLELCRGELRACAR